MNLASVDQAAGRLPPMSIKKSEHLLLRSRILTKAFDPFDAGFSPEPGELPLHVMPHVELGLFDCAFQGSLSVQIFDNAPVSMRAKRARVGGHSTFQKLTNLVNQSIGKMFFSPSVNPFVEFCARRIDCKDSKSRREVRRQWAQRSLPGNLLARLQIELDCPLNSRPVARAQLIGFV